VTEVDRIDSVEQACAFCGDLLDERDQVVVSAPRRGGGQFDFPVHRWCIFRALNRRYQQVLTPEQFRGPGASAPPA
jgi:hypothetical protein